MRTTTIAIALLLLGATSSAFAESSLRKSCDDLSPGQEQDSCRKRHGKSSAFKKKQKQLDKDKRKQKSRMKEANRIRENLNIEKNESIALKESRVIKTFFKKELMDKNERYFFAAKGIRDAYVIVNGEEFVSVDLTSADQLCMAKGFEGKLKGTRELLSEQFSTYTEGRRNKRQIDSSAAAIYIEDEELAHLTYNSSNYHHFRIFMRVTCFREKLNNAEDNSFSINDYKREIEKSKMSNRDYQTDKKVSERKGRSDEKEEGNYDIYTK